MKPPRPLAFRSLFQSEIDSSKNILPSLFVGVLTRDGMFIEKFRLGCLLLPVMNSSQTHLIRAAFHTQIINLFLKQRASNWIIFWLVRHRSNRCMTGRAGFGNSSGLKYIVLSPTPRLSLQNNNHTTMMASRHETERRNR